MKIDFESDLARQMFNSLVSQIKEDFGAEIDTLQYRESVLIRQGVNVHGLIIEALARKNQAIVQAANMAFSIDMSFRLGQKLSLGSECDGGCSGSGNELH
jgi:hypothetical protein